MRRPRIGIPLGLDDRGRWREGRDYLYIDRRYADAIARAGGQPIHLPIQPQPEGLIEGLDGLLVPGGDDLRPDPQRGESDLEIELDWVPDAQLVFDRGLLEAAMAAERPILGICYGMQLLARAGGGRLAIHLPTERPDAANHKLPSNEDRHPIEIRAESRLNAIFRGDRGSVNSLHHQAVAGVGPRHRISAESVDGVIEAIERPQETGAYQYFELGVQWHPEKLEDPASDALFEDFVSFCRERAAGGQDR